MNWREKLRCSERSFKRSRKLENRLQKSSIERLSSRSRRLLKRLRKSIRLSRLRLRDLSKSKKHYLLPKNRKGNKKK